MAVRIKEETGAQYAATNAFGVGVTVTPVRAIYLGLILPKKPALSVDLELRANPDQARHWKDAVGVLLTVGPGAGVTQRRTYEGFDRRTPTINTPVETDNVYKYLDLPVVATWLVNRLTGEVLAKFDGLP